MGEFLHVVDCETGEELQIPLTETDLQKEAEQLSLWKRLDAEVLKTLSEKEIKKAAVLDALADATGFTADELRDALNA